jgi:Raf kinase inhibitor-like YbhB/YbcL family protein
LPNSNEMSFQNHKLLFLILIIVMSKFLLESPRISNGGTIPVDYTCDGNNVSPLLKWSDPPRGTQSFVIIVDDPDAAHVVGHTFAHFAVINIDRSLRQLKRNQDFYEILPAMAMTNDSHHIGWTGPCPPRSDPAHSYRFIIYAVNVPIIPLKSDVKLTAEFFERYFGKFILDKSSFIGKYKRQA